MAMTIKRNRTLAVATSLGLADSNRIALRAFEQTNVVSARLLLGLGGVTGCAGVSHCQVLGN